MAHYGATVTPLAFQKLGLMEDPEKEKRKQALADEEKAVMERAMRDLAIGKVVGALNAPMPAPGEQHPFQSPEVGQAFMGELGGSPSAYLQLRKKIDPSDWDALDDAVKRSKYDIIVNKAKIEDQPADLHNILKEAFGQKDPKPQQWTLDRAVLNPAGYEKEFGTGSYDALMERYSQYKSAGRKPEAEKEEKPVFSPAEAHKMADARLAREIETLQAQETHTVQKAEWKDLPNKDEYKSVKDEDGNEWYTRKDPKITERIQRLQNDRNNPYKMQAHAQREIDAVRPGYDQPAGPEAPGGTPTRQQVILQQLMDMREDINASGEYNITEEEMLSPEFPGEYIKWKARQAEEGNVPR